MNFTPEILSLLEYLLPGFVTAWLFYSLTPYAKPSQFERVIEALIFTLVTQVFLHIPKHYPVVWNMLPELAWSLMISIILGLIFVYFANNDKIHKKLRDWHITQQTSFPSEWISAFQSDEYMPVVLHLHDGRRLYGEILDWPANPEAGHFVIRFPSWLVNTQEEPIIGVEKILIDVRKIEWVEFLQNTQENQND